MIIYEALGVFFSICTNSHPHQQSLKMAARFRKGGMREINSRGRPSWGGHLGWAGFEWKGIVLREMHVIRVGCVSEAEGTAEGSWRG